MRFCMNLFASNILFNVKPVYLPKDLGHFSYESANYLPKIHMLHYYIGIPWIKHIIFYGAGQGEGPESKIKSDSTHETTP